MCILCLVSVVDVHKTLLPLPNLSLYQFKTGALFPQTHTKSCTPGKPGSQKGKKKFWWLLKHLLIWHNENLCLYKCNVPWVLLITWTCLIPLQKEHWKLRYNDSFTYPAALILTYHIDFITLDKELPPPWSRKWHTAHKTGVETSESFLTSWHNRNHRT